MSTVTVPLGCGSDQGTTVVSPGTALEHPAFVDRLIRVADGAMYESKRAGGDRIQHVRPDEVVAE